MTIYDIIKELGITKGWSPLYGDSEIELNTGNIWICNKDCTWTILDENGRFCKKGECLVFPSKDNRDWNMVLDENKNKLLPVFTPIMVSDDGENWSVKYYKTRRFCLINKTSSYGSCYRYIVPVSKFDFEADDLSINIKNSI